MSSVNGDVMVTNDKRMEAWACVRWRNLLEPSRHCWIILVSSQSVLNKSASTLHVQQLHFKRSSRTRDALAEGISTECRFYADFTLSEIWYFQNSITKKKPKNRSTFMRLWLPEPQKQNGVLKSIIDQIWFCHTHWSVVQPNVVSFH